MAAAKTAVLYRHTGTALLRAAAVAPTEVSGCWPDLSGLQECRGWLAQVWSQPEIAEAIGQASPTLAGRVAAICADQATASGNVRPKDVRRAVLATARYLLRCTGRPTPFGLFAGVATARLGDGAGVRWGAGHRPVVRADTGWLSEIIDGLEAVPGLLERLEVMVTNLAVRRGRWLEAPHGPDRVRLSNTPALEMVRQAAAVPIRFGVLADKLTASFAADPAAARRMLTELVGRRVLITCLRAPLTVTDPLGHLLDRLHDADGDSLPEVAALLTDLEQIHDRIHQHNHRTAPGIGAGADTRRAIITMRQIAASRRSPLAVDLRLDCEVRIPEQVPLDVERAAGVLLWLARHPDGAPGWRAYHRAFVDRYGTGTLVPVSEAVHPDSGVGYPPTYPGSLLPDPAEVPTERDRLLLAAAWRAMACGSGEVVITDAMVAALSRAGSVAAGRVPSHVEIAARIHAPSLEALNAGEYQLLISPARAAGVMTSRFTLTATGTGLEGVYRELPVGSEGALPVQMSFGAAYPYAENIVRVPAYLPHVLCLGEHRTPDRQDGQKKHGQKKVEVIGLDDVAITAATTRLHLVSLSRRRVLEPLVFHALDLGKQPAPLARFIASLTAGFTHGWTAFDWGPVAGALPYLPRVRYGRVILSPARWRTTADDLPGRTPDAGWRQTLTAWRRRWRCPPVVELRDDDRTLRLNLDVPLHAALLHAHLARHQTAVLTEAPDPAAFGWIGGHAHEIAIPLVTTLPAAPVPLAGFLPTVTNTTGQMPAAPDARWLYARLHAHPDLHDQIIACHLPALLSGELDGAQAWFVRYHSPDQTDHLRLRVHLPDPNRYGAIAAAVGAWAHQLRRDRLAAHLVFDTYLPEVGRYGTGAALEAAETVFVTDSRLAIAQLRHLQGAISGRVDPVALAAANMVGIAAGFLGTRQAAGWLTTRRPADPPPDRTIKRPVDRAVADAAIELTLPVLNSGFLDTDLPNGRGWPSEVIEAWQARAAALAAYRAALPTDADIDTVVESLLHMHHNRARGIDPDSEATCRRLARSAALSWRARHPQQVGADR